MEPPASRAIMWSVKSRKVALKISYDSAANSSLTQVSGHQKAKVLLLNKTVFRKKSLGYRKLRLAIQTAEQII
jgi:hypothetical protein